MFDCLQRVSGITASVITVVGSEDALQIICQVIESHGVKKISPEGKWDLLIQVLYYAIYVVECLKLTGLLFMNN